MRTQECPICLKSVTSDATLASYCNLCGMSIDDEPVFIRKAGKQLVFCCEGCEIKFKKYSKVRKNETNN